MEDICSPSLAMTWKKVFCCVAGAFSQAEALDRITARGVRNSWETPEIKRFWLSCESKSGRRRYPVKCQQKNVKIHSEPVNSKR